MDDLSRRFEALGGAVAEVSDRKAEDGSGRAAIDKARRAFLAPQPVPRAQAGRARVVALLAAAAVALLTIGAWISRTPRSLSFEVASSVGAHPQAHGSARPGVVGEWVAADPGAPLSLRFSDASALSLAPGGRMRVTTTNPRGADVLIERGSVHAAIAHATQAARWALRAGPFEVRVTGTVFDAAWDPVTESFELVMHEGSVIVTGPLIPPERAVVAGERLRVSVRDARMELTKGPQVVVTVGPPATPPPAVADADAHDVKPAPVPGPAPSADPQQPAHADAPKHAASSAQPDASPAPAHAAPAWKELAAAGKYRDALAAAEAAGFDGEIARASASELLLLADAARLGGSPARARAALLAARSRFGARGHTAFLLGKIAADQGGSAGDAITWLETYLREDPRGAFAEQALGRIVELSRRDRDAGARAAARYLAKYPNGAHAALARSLVAAAEQPASPAP